MYRSLILYLVACEAVIVFNEPTLPLWSSVPVVMAAGALLVSFRIRSADRQTTAALFCFAVVAPAIIAAHELAWRFDMGGYTQGSTSAVAFAFVPVIAVALAVISFVIAWFAFARREG